MSRQDQYDVTAVVTWAGESRELGTFDSFSGGEVDSEETKYWPGGLGTQISLGGRQEVSNVVIGRLYDLARDHLDIGWLLRAVGKAEVEVTKASLSVDGAVVGKPLIYRGTLKRVAPPEHDSTSSSAATWELEVTSATVTQ